jgi:ADP-ribose pyrophosphatase YjhB (NUDIX family)
MRFCCSCGNPVALQRVAQDARARFVCVSCGTIYYANPRVLVGCLAYYHDRILLCKRALEPCRGLWSIPAGFMEENESLEQGAARETLEETGVEVDPAALALYRVVSLPDLSQVYVVFRVQLRSIPPMNPGPESLDVALIGESDLPSEQWAFTSFHNPARLAELFGEIRSGSFLIHQTRLSGNIHVHRDSRTYALKQD